MAEVENADREQGELVIFCGQTVLNRELFVVATQKIKTAKELGVQSLRLACLGVDVILIPTFMNLFLQFGSSGFCAGEFFIVLIGAPCLQGTKVVVGDFISKLASVENRFVRCLSLEVGFDKSLVLRQNFLKLIFSSFAATDADT